jgi:prophage tail gpP-like protein
MIVVVDSERFDSWTSLTVTRSLDTMVHSFDLDYSDQWAESGAERVSVLGSALEISEGTERVLTGYVDQTRYVVSDGSVAGSTQGRSLTGDLVDCSVVHATGHWASQTASQIIRDVTAPFEISVEIDPEIVDTTRLPRMDIWPGDTVFGVVDKLCRLRGWLPTSTPLGGLRITRVRKNYGARAVTMDLSQVLSREYAASTSELYSEYTVLSQTHAADVGDGARRTIEEHASYADKSVARYRPLVTRASTGAKSSHLRDVAQWTANQRVAASERLVYEVAGTLAPNDATWYPGWSIYVRDDVMGVDGIYLLASARISARAESLTTQLQLVWPESYSIEPTEQRRPRIVQRRGRR